MKVSVSSILMSTNQARTPEFEEALQLSSRILSLARAHDHDALLRIVDDPASIARLDLLEDDIARAARTHLEGAVVWRKQREAISRRRLDEAQEALDALDFALARSLLRRLEGEYVDDGDLERRDALFLDLEARMMETEQLQQSAAELIAERRPRGRRWKKKRR